MNAKRIRIFLYVPLLWLFACGNRSDKPSYTDTPTSGTIDIVVDESYEPLIKVQLDTFMRIYKYATIRARYLPEAEVINELLHNDSVRIAITARKLTKDETTVFDQQRIIPRYIKIAVDAVALLVHPDNPDTALGAEQLHSIIRGTTATWKALDPKRGSADTIRIVFDRSGSSNTRYLKEQFLEGGSFPPNCYATNSNADVVDYVATHPNALGVISLNWISDSDDPTANEFLKKVRVVYLAAEGESSFVQPYQAYIALKSYPLTRDVYIISREGRNGLGTGFASFAAADQGQRLVRMMGLLPATMPVRIVNLHE
jgi:phosphate transport system substrate-binding protein